MQDIKNFYVPYKSKDEFKENDIKLNRTIIDVGKKFYIQPAQVRWDMFQDWDFLYSLRTKNL